MEANGMKTFLVQTVSDPLIVVPTIATGRSWVKWPKKHYVDENSNGMVTFLIFTIKRKNLPTLYNFTLSFLFLALWTNSIEKDLVLNGFVQVF
jgi:hypothetical protein